MNPPPDPDPIEQVLRHAPQPAPPPDLRHRLVEGIARPPSPNPRPATHGLRPSWFRRWWPALAAGALALGASAVVVVQQTQIQRLERTLHQLRQELDPPTSAHPPADASALPAAPGPGLTTTSPAQAAELESLRARVKELAADVHALEAMQSENARLKAQAAKILGLSPEALAELEQAREKAQCITCANNLKQLGLAARIWSTDNGDVLPPDLLSMSNEISVPKVLVCPSDPGRQPASDWASFTLANSSYEFLAANSPETEPQRVAFRCPIHGNIGLVDGSVQMNVAKDHPDWLVLQEGKWMFQPPRPATPPPPDASSAVPPANRVLMERYGLLPTPAAGADPSAAVPQPPPGMSEQMLRRYGLLPTNAAGSTAPPLPPAPEEQP